MSADMKSGSSTKQYLTFLLNSETYAFEVLKIKEVLEYPKLTKLPQMPDYMEGIMNLRGSGVPIIDLRKKFGMEPKERDVDSSIIIVELEEEGEISYVGALVDAVREVVKFEESELENAPKLGMDINSAYISNMGKIGENFVIILNMGKVFSEQEMNILQEANISDMEEGDEQ